MKHRVRSFDLYETLISKRAPDQPENVFPIAEMQSRLRPEDVIVSDMDLSASQLQALSGLGNKMYVTRSGKRDGTIWPMVLSEYELSSHVGDNQDSDVFSPERFGIRGELCRLAEPTAQERAVARYFPVLSQVMRETRLRTYDPSHRELEMLESQINLPFLFCVAVYLDWLARRENYQRLLLCARDCFLLFQVQQLVRRLSKSDYSIYYLPTSRYALTRGSNEYLMYLAQFADARSLIVDLVGTGRSLSRLKQRLLTKVDLDALTIVRYPSDSPTPYLVQLCSTSGRVEQANLAPHAMYTDLDHGQLIGRSFRIDWDAWQVPRVMYHVIATAIDAAAHYGLERDLETGNELSCLHWLVGQLLATTALDEVGRELDAEEVEVRRCLDS